MTRHDRRAMKHHAHDVAHTSTGTLSERDPNYGLRVDCYVCGVPHLARGLARIQDKSGTTDVLLCNSCLGVRDVDKHDTHNRIIKKYWNAPDLKVREGGELTTEQLLALVERQGSALQ
jgi:hypothetical protein